MSIIDKERGTVIDENGEQWIWILEEIDISSWGQNRSTFRATVIEPNGTEHDLGRHDAKIKAAMAIKKRLNDGGIETTE